MVVGLDPHIGFKKLVKTTSYLGNPDCLFVASNEDAMLPCKGPILIPGTRACCQFVLLLETAAVLFVFGEFVAVLCVLVSSVGFLPSL